MDGPVRHLLHALCIAAGIGVAIVGAIVFRSATDDAQTLTGSLLTAAGGLSIYFAYRILPPAD